jgi:hypothetical protein
MQSKGRKSLSAYSKWKWRCFYVFFKSTILHVVNLNFTVSKLTEPGVDVPGSIPRQERGFFLPPRPDADSCKFGIWGSVLTDREVSYRI